MLFDFLKIFYLQFSLLKEIKMHVYMFTFDPQKRANN